jgi:hypothetical protein
MLPSYPFSLGMASPHFIRVFVCGAFAAAWFCLGCGASEPKGPANAVCYTKRPVAENGGFRPLRPNHWMNALLKGFRWKRSRGETTYQAYYDCTGEPITEDRAPAQCPQEPLDVFQPVALKDSSVLERSVPTGERLVWVLTHRFSNGDGLGPIALAATENENIVVRIVGRYRGRAERVQMHLWSVGEGQVLVVEGERCQNPKTPATCQREARILVVDRNRFLLRPIVDSEGRCIEAPQIEYSRKAEVSIESGWVRRFNYHASVSHDVRYLVVTEQIDVNDFDPSQPNMPPRHVRRVDTERFIHLKGLKLVSRQGPLWRRMMPTRGSTQLDGQTKGATP